jgi:lysophospholipase L1-like esterase
VTALTPATTAVLAPPGLTEDADPHVLSAAEEHQLLRGAPWKRFAVVGDSVAEGLGEPADGYESRDWHSRIARALRRERPELEHLNLGTRYLRAGEVREQQLEPALDFEPDLVSIVCGGNDMLAEDFDPAAVRAEIDAMATPLRESGAELLFCTMFAIFRAIEMQEPYGSRLAARQHELNEVIRDLAGGHDAVLAEFFDHPASADPGIYSSDLMHCNMRGHAIAASGAIEALGARLRSSEPQA